MRREGKRTVLSLILIPVIALVMLAATETHASAASGKYWIKINKKKCVATVYKKIHGKWKPYRAMLCAVGKGSTPTPSGTYHLGGKFRWIRMTTEGVVTYEQYTTRFHGEYYVHSPCYSAPRRNKEKAHTFYTLGKHVTHGCVRFAVMDAKWIYENCKRGTKLTVYKSKNPGPLGKPEKIKYVKKHGRAWDPTDPNKKNPHFHMRPPEFTIQKADTVLYGRKYDLKAGVKVMNTNAIQDLTGKMKVKGLTRNGNPIKVKSFSTEKLGAYKVTYYVRDKYCIKKGGKGTKEVFSFQVIDRSSIDGTSDKARELKDKALETGNKANLLKGITAKSLSRNLTDTIKVTVVAPDGSEKTLSAEAAKRFEFDQAGTYKVSWSVTNPYPRKKVTKSIKVKVTAAPEPETNPEQQEQGADQQTGDQQVQGEQPAQGGQPASGQSAVSSKGAARPAADRQTGEQQVQADQPAPEQPASDQPASEQSDTEQQSSAQPEEGVTESAE